MLLALASAFACPTIATGTPNALSFDVAQVVIVRQGQRTTFSVSINPLGEGQGFALVMPVPEILDETEVRTIDGTIFATLDAYTAPRHVADAGCPSDTYPLASDSDGDGYGGGRDDGGSVEVEAEYLVGDYLITILSADESTALDTWLDTHGYYLAPGAEPVLAEYIEGGSYFLAAKVADGAARADGTPLAPLQIAYDSPLFGIPIRLAAVNSPGEQDMLIYAITDSADGEVGISSYTEFDVPETCVWGDPATDDFATFYDDVFTTAHAAVGDAAWTTEFAGYVYDCNPCTGVYPTEADLGALGFVGDWQGHYLTRLHMRYTAEQAFEDLTLYASGLHEPKVLSFADDVELNDCIETCTDAEAEVDPATCGCDSGGAQVGLAGLIALGLVRRRRA